MRPVAGGASGDRACRPAGPHRGPCRLCCRAERTQPDLGRPGRRAGALAGALLLLQQGLAQRPAQAIDLESLTDSQKQALSAPDCWAGGRRAPSARAPSNSVPQARR